MQIDNPGVFEKYGETTDAGKIIFCEWEPGDSFYIIVSGKVRLSKVVKEKEKTLDIIEDGDIFGEMAILEQAPRSATAIAETNVRLLKFNRQNFEILLKGDPAMALKLLKVFSKRIYDAKRRLKILTLDDSPSKVADTFLMLCETKGELPDIYVSRELNVTTEDIAHWAGLKVDECDKALNAFVKGGKIQIGNGKIVLSNLNDFVRHVQAKRKKDKVS